MRSIMSHFNAISPSPLRFQHAQPRKLSLPIRVDDPSEKIADQRASEMLKSAETFVHSLRKQKESPYTKLEKSILSHKGAVHTQAIIELASTQYSFTEEHGPIWHELTLKALNRNETIELVLNSLTKRFEVKWNSPEIQDYTSSDRIYCKAFKANPSYNAADKIMVLFNILSTRAYEDFSKAQAAVKVRARRAIL